MVYEVKHNRRKKTIPKLGRGWCMGCDRAYINDGEKCPVCGFKEESHHQKTSQSNRDTADIDDQINYSQPKESIND